MNSELELYYQHFQDSSIDSQRAKVYDEIMADDYFPVEMKNKLEQWSNQYGATKGVGVTMAKSLAISFLRIVMATKEEREQMMRMGRLHHSLAPNWTVDEILKREG